MKKRIIILSAIFAALFTSCAIDPLADGDGRRGTTTITFTPDFGDIAGGQNTKAFGVNPQVQNLYLAVFNEGGTALVEYVKAESVQLATANGTKYSYKATLKVTDKERVVHLIANAPEEIGYGSAEDAVGGLLYNFDTSSWTGQDAYWGYVELPDGICAQSDVSGCNALIAKFSEVKLVRNFAQIKVSAAAGSNFTVTRFWISNFPDRASAAPYNRSGRRFETAYSGYEYATSAMDNGYEGFCPATAGLVSLRDLDVSKLPGIACAPGGTAFTYEREMPVSDPLCIIVGGTSNLTGGGTETFYKIDLRDNNGKYIPILRNFIYEVSIGNVLKVGEPSVEAALNSVSSGAIDTDLSLKDLKDLSNGKSRIAVSETERVIFADGQFNLFYSFIPDIESGTVVNKTLADWVAEGTYASGQAVLDAHAPYVTVVSESHGESGSVIDSFTIATTDETDGYRAVTMVPVPVGGTTRTEVFTVTGHVWNSVKNAYETLQRKVSYQMRERPQMALKLSREGVSNTLGDTIKVKIGIEENLPKSLFTVDMKITTEQMSLTPDSNDLTISSEVGVDGKPTFYITKAITWEEYNRTASVLDSDGKYRKYFTCPLKTNTSVFRDVDASFGPGDRIIVANDDFETATALFMAGNINLKRFINLHLDKEYFVTGRPATISFGMTKLPTDGHIYVGLKSLKPYDDSLVSDGTDGEGYTLYEIPVSSTDSESLELIPTASSGLAYVKLVKEGEFNPVFPLEKGIQMPGFDDLKFKYQNLDYVVSNKEALACFHMDYLPLDDAKVTIHLRNAVPVDGTLVGTGPDITGYTSYQISVTDNDIEFPVRISPASASETKACFKLTADNHKASDPAEATIQKLQFSGLELLNVNNPAKNYVVGGKPARISFSLDDMPGEGNVVKLTLSNLTIPTGAAMTHGSYQKVSDTEYTLSITDKDDVTIEVIPAMGATSASYTLSDTTSEFDTKTCTADIQKLSFTGLKLVNVNDPTKGYVIGGKPARIEFTLEDMPTSAHETITLTLTNLTIPEGATTSGISSITGSGNVYQIIASAQNVTIDVKPAVGENLKASYTLANDEFNEGAGKTDVPIEKLSFSNTEFIVNTTPADYLLAGDATSQIKFTMDQLPDDGNVTLWIKNAAPLGQAVQTDGQFHSYVIPVSNKETTLDIEVGNVTGTNPQAEFYLSDGEFKEMTDTQHAKANIRTRYTIVWSNVQIWSDDPNAAANGQSVNVYRNDATCSGTPIATFTTDGSGMASGTDYVVDAANGTTDKFYFKFTKNNNPNSGVDYISAAVNLEDIANKTSTVKVTCKIQKFTIPARSLNFGNINGGTGFLRFGSYTNETGQISFAITSQSSDQEKGKNRNAIEVICSPGTVVYFYVNGNKGFGPIENFINGHTF